MVQLSKNHKTMAKLTLLAASLMITLSIVVVAAPISAPASSHGITDENSRHSEHAKSKGLEECEKFLAKSCGRVLMVTHITIRNGSCRRGLQLCCEELEQIEVQRRCVEIRRLVKQQLGEFRCKEMQEMLQKAKNLPALCRMGIGRCDIRPSSSWTFANGW